MVYLIGQSIKQVYFAPTLSQASCFCVLIYVGALVVSYLLAFGIQGSLCSPGLFDIEKKVIIKPFVTVKCGDEFYAQLMIPSRDIIVKKLAEAASSVKIIEVLLSHPRSSRSRHHLNSGPTSSRSSSRLVH